MKNLVFILFTFFVISPSYADELGKSEATANPVKKYSCVITNASLQGVDLPQDGDDESIDDLMRSMEVELVINEGDQQRIELNHAHSGVPLFCYLKDIKRPKDNNINDDQYVYLSEAPKSCLFEPSFMKFSVNAEDEKKNALSFVRIDFDKKTKMGRFVDEYKYLTDSVRSLVYSFDCSQGGE